MISTSTDDYNDTSKPKKKVRKKAVRNELPILNFFTRPAMTEVEKVQNKETALEILRKTFKIDNFRDMQEDIIMEVFKGKDVFVIMPTGSGKSLTYQLPAVMSRGITLVISPLISLIQNQVQYLSRLNIKAGAINCNTPISVKRQLIEDISSNNPSIKLLFVTPELLSKSHMKELLHNANSLGNIQRLVVDEAHCISEWGHNFRADYRKLAWIREELRVPVTALTATARKEIRKDISTQLHLDPNHKVFAVSPARPNIYYEVIFKMPNRNYQYDIIRVIKKLYSDSCNINDLDRPSVIVYCSTKAECDYLSETLQANDIKASPYHSDLSNKDREKSLKNWLNNSIHNPEAIDVMIATIAFGMGIDKHSVRLVIHCDPPKSLEAYCQESGRAGRDNKPSKSTILYSRSDRDRIIWLLMNQKKNERLLQNFKKVVEYCEETNICRHKFLSDYYDGLTSNINEYRNSVKCYFCNNRNCDRCYDHESLVLRKHEYERSTNVLNPLPPSPPEVQKHQPSPTSPLTSKKIVSASNLYKKILENRKRKREELLLTQKGVPESLS